MSFTVELIFFMHSLTLSSTLLFTRLLSATRSPTTEVKGAAVPNAVLRLSTDFLAAPFLLLTLPLNELSSPDNDRHNLPNKSYGYFKPGIETGAQNHNNRDRIQAQCKEKDTAIQARFAHS